MGWVRIDDDTYEYVEERGTQRVHISELKARLAELERDIKQLQSELIPITENLTGKLLEAALLYNEGITAMIEPMMAEKDHIELLLKELEEVNGT